MLQNKFCHLVSQGVKVARSLILAEYVDELWVFLIELLSQEVLLECVALERVKQDFEEVLLQLFFALLGGPLVALARGCIGPVLFLSHLLLCKVFEILHELIDSEQCRALVDSLAEDIEISLILHASLVSDHCVFLVCEELFLKRLEGLLRLSVEI